jgi:capsular polysaccharide biosynthesis protein
MAYQYTRLTPVLSGWPTIFFACAIGLLLGTVLSFLRPLEYSSKTRLLITQELGAVDAYTASRSAERIAYDLASIVYTSTFYDAVMDAGYDIDESYFPSDEIKKRKKWAKAVTASVVRGTGLLTITAYQPDVEQAELIAKAVSRVLVTEGWTYTSGGDITVKAVDEPLNSQWPVRPNVLLNAFSGLILGGLAGIGYILIQVERVKRRHQVLHEE